MIENEVREDVYGNAKGGRLTLRLTHGKVCKLNTHVNLMRVNMATFVTYSDSPGGLLIINKLIINIYLQKYTALYNGRSNPRVLIGL